AEKSRSRGSPGRVTSTQEQLGQSRSTCYRHLKSLVDRGYLVSSIGGGYTLGPQIMNLEAHMRLSDPLILKGRPVLEELANDYAATAMICRVFRESFVSIYSVQSVHDPRIRVARGRALPLVRGATARIIQAHLPRHRLVKLYNDHETEFAELGFQSLPELLEQLKVIKKRGSVRVFGEVNPGVNAVSAPLFTSAGVIEGTVTLTAPEKLLTGEVMGSAEERISFCARLLCKLSDSRA
ncbi:MAG: IclR family transcriptional regulator C-terminal domain-containing protein, partial [Pseudomonadota bacterium]